MKKLNKLTIIGPHKSGTKFCNKILINNFGNDNVSYEVRRHATGGPFKFSEKNIVIFKKNFSFEYLLIIRERKTYLKSLYSYHIKLGEPRNLILFQRIKKFL